MKLQDLMKILEKHYKSENRTTLNRMRGEDPFKILIGCLVSINIKDSVTERILEELFSKADSFRDIINMDTNELEQILYLARYRKIKAARLKSISKEILERFNGKVPDNSDDLLSIKGIGPKTCNVVLNFAFNQPKIPVDSNTVRITNRLGFASSKKPEIVEAYLVENLDNNLLKNANAIFMLHGRNTCTPINPKCNTCPVEIYCKKVI